MLKFRLCIVDGLLLVFGCCRKLVLKFFLGVEEERNGDMLCLFGFFIRDEELDVLVFGGVGVM